VEVYNRGSSPVPLVNFYFSEGITFTFPNVMMQPGDYFVIGDNPAALTATLGAVNVFQWTSSGLSNSGETLILKNPAGDVIDSVTYSDVAPWPTSPDGNGPSLVFCDPSLDNNDPANWTASVEYAGLNAAGDTLFGTPGSACTGSGIFEPGGQLVDWSLFPVPASEQVSLVLPAGTWEVRILDLSGRLMQAVPEVRSGDVMDISTLNPGLFIVRVSQSTGNLSGMRKLVVE